MSEQTSFTEKKKWYLIPGLLSVLLNLLVWATGGIYFLAVHNTEMKELKNNFNKFSAEITEHSKKIERINSTGSDALLAREKDLIAIKAKVETLENFKILGDQKETSMSKEINGLDTRVTRLEDAIPKISLMGQRIENVEKIQTEMRVDLKEFSKMQVQIVELKGSVEKAILQNK